MSNREFVAENYVKEELIFKRGREIWFSILVMTIHGMVFGGLFYLLWPENIDAGLSMGGEALTRLTRIGITLGIILFVGVILHEIIHAIFYAIFCKNKFKSVKIGIRLLKGYAYCECKEILPTNKFAVGLLMPAILTGIVPSIISLFTGNFDLLFFSMIWFAMSGSDLLTFKKIARNMKGTWFENAVAIEKWYVYKPIKSK